MEKKYTKEQVLKLVKDFYDKNGKITTRDLTSKNGLPTQYVLINLFGSYKNCLDELGIDTSASEFYREYRSDERLLQELKEFTERHLENNLFLPTLDEIDREPSLVSSGTYIDRLGTTEQFYKMIGYDLKEFNRSRILQDIKKKYIECCQKYGKTLNSRDITRLSKQGECYSTECITTNFGTLHNFQRECGLIPTVVGKNMSKEEAISALIQLAKELGRTPMQEDLIKYDYVPSSCHYCKLFGSFKNALKEAGLEVNKIYYSKLGTRCNSSYEVKIANALEKHNIPYQKEIRYDKVIDNFDKRYRFDFVFDINGTAMYVEYFGITGVDSYYDKTNEKIQICKDNNINLIPLFKEDLFSKTYDQIYQMFVDKAA